MLDSATQKDSRRHQQLTPAGALALLVALGAGGAAPILIRYAQNADVSSLGLATWRMVLAALLLLPLFMARPAARQELPRLKGPTLFWLGLSGALLAVYFAAWTYALEYASVLVATVLSTSSPLWVALLERYLLKAPLPRYLWYGAALVMAGNIGIALAKNAVDSAPNMLLGGGLALFAALAVAAHRIIGREMSYRVSFLSYLWLVYSLAGGLLGLVALLVASPLLGYSAVGWFWVVSVALLPQFIGHSASNYALRHLPVTYTSLFVQGRAVISAGLAYFILSEVPTLGQIVASVVVLTGVALATIGQGGRG